MEPRRKVTWPRRGDVYLVAFDPTLGAEIKKTRPALILQNDIANRYSPITIVAAITSRFHEELYPTEVLLEPPEGGLKVTSVVQLDQIRSIDKQRLVRRLGRVAPRTIHIVDRAIAISLGLVDLA
jgi:mRNA interferase MazF